MAKEVPWNKFIYDRFCELAMLTDDERLILETRIRGWSRVKQTRELNMSRATVDRHIRRLKIKYDEVQKHDDLLPPRRYSKEEERMDTALE